MSTPPELEASPGAMIHASPPPEGARPGPQPTSQIPLTPEIVGDTYAQYVHTLQSLARRRVWGMVDSSDAEDVLQTALLNVLQKAKDGTAWVDAERPERLVRYLSKAIGKIAINRARRQQRFGWVSFDEGWDDPSKPRPIEPADPDSTSLVDSDLYVQGVLNVAREHLNEKHYKMLELTVLKGLTRQQVADTMDIPLGTVQSKMFAIGKRLRKILPSPTSP